MGASEKPRDGAGGNGRTTLAGQINGLPALGSQVVLHAGNVVAGSPLHHNENDTGVPLPCQYQSFAARCDVATAHYDRPRMGSRPIFMPDLGTYFVSLREGRGWKQMQAAAIAHRRGIPLSYQALRGLEGGKTKSPDPAVLRAVAALYQVPYEQVVERVVAVRYGLDDTSAAPAEPMISDEALTFARRFDQLEPADRAVVTKIVAAFEKPEIAAGRGAAPRDRRRGRDVPVSTGAGAAPAQRSRRRG